MIIKWIAFLSIFLTAITNSEAQISSAATKKGEGLHDQIRQLELAENKDSAIVVLQQMQANITSDKEAVLVAHIALGNIYTRKGNLDLALKELDKALVIAQHKTKYLSLVYNNMGNAYNYLSNQDEAAQCYHKSVTAAQKYSDSKFPATYAYNNLATILSQQKQYDKALGYIEQGIKVARSKKDYKFLSTLINNKGINQNLKTDYQPALATLHTSEEIARAHGYQANLFTALLNSGSIYLTLQQPDKASTKLKEAEKLLELNSNISTIEIHSLYSLLSDVAYQRKQYEIAQRYLEKSEQYESHSLYDQSLIYHKKAKLAEAKGDYKAANEMLDNYYALKDSLSNQDIILKVQNLETQYRTLEKDKEINEQNAKIILQSQQLLKKNLWIAITVLGLLLTLAVLAWRRFKLRARISMQHKLQEIDRLNHILKGEELERKRIAQELHDGINSQLSGAKSFLLVVGKKFPEVDGDEYFLQAKDILDITATDLRKMAHNLAPIAIANGIQHAVHQFLERVQTAGTPIEFQSYGDFGILSEEQTLNVFRIIQELVHNALKHAQATAITVLLNEHQEEYCIIVEDNGIGMKDANLADAKGIGLANVKNRLDLLQGNMTVEKGQRGTTFLVYVPKATVMPNLKAPVAR